MIARLVTLSVERRWLVMLFTGLAALAGVFALQRLPIDAVPDITNNQVQINTTVGGLIPEEIERSIEVGCQAHLTKPVSRQVLMSEIKKFVFKN